MIQTRSGSGQFDTPTSNPADGDQEDLEPDSIPLGQPRSNVSGLELDQGGTLTKTVNTLPSVAKKSVGSRDWCQSKRAVKLSRLVVQLAELDHLKSFTECNWLREGAAWLSK